MLAETLVVLDFETTGLRPDHGDRITEVAALRVHNGVVTARYETLVNCHRRLPNHIRAFTGINQQMVDNAPEPWQVFSGLLSFIGDAAVVSHNAAFDQGFLDCECERLHLQCASADFICTVQLARHLLPNLPSYSLHALVRHFKLSNTAEHRAGLDADATLQVLLQLGKLSAAQAPGRYVDSYLLRELIASNQLANHTHLAPALARIA